MDAWDTYTNFGSPGACTSIFGRTLDANVRCLKWVTSVGLGPLATVPLIPPIADMRADINF